MSALGYDPHLTLAVYDNVAEGDLSAALTAIFRGRRRLRLTFSHLGLFEQHEFVIWASPNDHTDLLRLHQAVHAEISPLLCDVHYRPGQWVAHCTLATNVAGNRRQQARDAVEAGIEPFEAVFAAAEAVRFPPPSVFASVALQ